MNSKIKKKEIQIYLAKYMRIFMLSKGWINIISTLIITGLIVFVTTKDTFITYTDTRTGVFAFVCAAIWIGLFNSIQTICQERATIKQEHMSGVDYSTFLIAHMAFEFILCVIETICMLFVISLKFAPRLNLAGNFDLTIMIKLFISFLLIIYNADMLGLMISTIVKTGKQAMTVMPFVLIVQLVLSDFIFKLEGLAKYLSNLTIVKWGMAAVLITVDVNQKSTELQDTNGVTDEALNVINSFLSRTKMDNLKYYNPERFHFLKVCLVLLAFIIVEVIITKYAMNLIDKDRR